MKNKLQGKIALIVLISALFAVITPTGPIFPQGSKMTIASKNEKAFNFLSFPPHAELLLDPDNGTIRYLKGKNLSMEPGETHPKADKNIDIALSFIERYKTLFKLENPREELRSVSSAVDELGLRHIRFGQFYKGIEVVNGELNVHMDQHNAVYLVQGKYIPTPNHVQINPTLLADKAIQRVFNETGIKKKDSGEDDVELVIYAKPSEKPLLVFKIAVPGWIYYVDAANGKIVDRTATRHTAFPNELIPRNENPVE